MKVTRLIISGIPYKLTRIDKDIYVDDVCELCAVKRFCIRGGDQEIRGLCDMEVQNIESDTLFVVDDDLDKTIREVMKEKLKERG